METDCDESFSDFQKTKTMITRRVGIQHKHVKKKKKICPTQPVSISECAINNHKKFMKTQEQVKEVNSKCPNETTESSVNSEDETKCKTFGGRENLCETGLNIRKDTFPNKPIIEPMESDIPVSQEKISTLESVSRHFLSDESVHPSEWTCVICQKSVWQQDRHSHFANCIKTYGHKVNSVRSSSSETVPSPFICDVCKLDITHLSVQERCEHINRCLDSEVVNIEHEDASTMQSTITITECPLCFKNCSTVEARLVHIKKCSKALGIDVPSVIVALQLQQKHTAERISLGLPPVQTRPAVNKTSEKLRKKVVQEPKSENDANIQLAKALSLSVQEEARQKELTEFSDVDLLKFSFPKGTPLHLKPPKIEEKPGKKKKKNVNKPVPVLLLRTDEERQKLLEERVSSIITVQCETESSENEPKFPNEKCPLWVLCGIAEQKMTYYVQDIKEFVTPSEIEAGSKLRSLSQVPGHHIFTQQPCDYTFHYSQETVANISSPLLEPALTIPSTQEMIDVIVNVDDEVDEKRDRDHTMEYVSIQKSGPDKNHDAHEHYAKENDGFFCEVYDHEIAHNPVIDSLMTLVGSTWLSDVDIIVSGGGTIPAHALLLKLRCPALQTMLNVYQEERIVLDWKDVSHDVASHFLHYVYTGFKKWPVSLNAEVENLIKRCEMKPYKEMNCKSAKDISMSSQGTTSFVDLCQQSYPETSPHKDAFCKQFSSQDLLSRNLNSCFSPERHCGQQDSENTFMISQKGNDIISHTHPSSSSREICDSPCNADDPEISICHETKPMSLEKPACVKTLVSVFNSLEHENTSECSHDLFECETDDDRPCDVASVDHLSNEKRLSDIVKGSSELHGVVSNENDIILCDTTAELCHNMSQNSESSNTFESIQVLPGSTVSHPKILNTVAEHCNSSSSTHLPNEEKRKDIIESKLFPDVADGCRDTLHNFNNISLVDDDDNNYLDIVSSPLSHHQNCSDVPKCSGLMPRDSCIASPLSSVVASAIKFETLSPNCMSGSLNNLRTSKTSGKGIKLKKNNSESSIAFSTPLSKVTDASFSEIKLSENQVKKRGFGSTEELTTSYCDTSVGLKGKLALEMLSTSGYCFAHSQELGKVRSPPHSPIVLSSDDEIIDEVHAFQPEKIERNSKQQLSPVSHSQVHSHHMKFESSDDEVELVPLHMRIASNAGEKHDDEDVQVIFPPHKNDMESSELISQNQKCEYEGLTQNSINDKSPSPDSSTMGNKANKCEMLGHLLHAKKLPVSEIQISDSPVTPLPDYRGMITPDIKIALRKYGIRALPKKQAVAILTHIYEETHPWVEQEGEASKTTHLGPSTSADSLHTECKVVSKKRKAVENKVSTHQEPSPKKSKLKQNKSSKTGLKKASSEEGDNFFSSSESSDLEDMLEKSYDEIEAEVCSQNTTDSMKTLLHEFIRTNSDLYSKILQYEPLNLGNFHQELKDNGMKMSSAQLMDFLDEECITFTLPRSEKYKTKQQARTQKFRKRMIAQLSQPSAQNAS